MRGCLCVDEGVGVCVRMGVCVNEMFNPPYTELRTYEHIAGVGVSVGRYLATSEHDPTVDALANRTSSGIQL